MIPEQLSPRSREIVVAARELLEEEGAAAMSMRRVAERLGIRAPSLYKHFPDKQALENALVSDGFGELALAFQPARAVRDRIGALAAVYRAFALRHPHLYRLMTNHPLHREGLDPGVEDRAAAPLIEAVGGDTDLARAIWAFAHGMTILELNGRFPAGADLDAAWERGVEALGSRRSARSSA